MSNALSVADGANVPATSGTDNALAGGKGLSLGQNPMDQMRGFLSQPAVKRSLPLILLVSLVAAAALAWLAMSTPPQRALFTNLPESDKAAVVQALNTAGIANKIDSTGSITVNEDDFHKARMLLAGQDLPKAAPGGYALLDQMPMGASRAVEGERLRQARETELARSIAEIDTVAEARVHLATPEASVFVRDKSEPSASVIVRLQPGRTLSDAQVRSIVNLVASSVPGMKADAVTIVDQMGALLSKSGQEVSAGDARIDFQNKVEDKVRQQLMKLLTPMLGAGNFSAEVQAEVDLNEVQATREVYDKDGSVIRTEQGSWTGAPRNTTPGGIPGALSNVAPPPSTVTTPEPAPEATPAPTAEGEGAAAPAAAAAAQAAAAGIQQSDSFARTYSNGREISVSRSTPGGVTRLSVAVVLREEDGKPRSQVELRQIDSLVKAAVGYNAARQDQVTVVSRKFSSNMDGNADATPFYETSWFAMLARNVTAVAIALLVLLIGVRPLVRSMTGKRKEKEEAAVAALTAATDAEGAEGAAEEAQAVAPAPAPLPPVTIPPPVSPEMLAGSELSLSERVDLVREFTRDNPARAALAVRDMIRAEAQ